MKVELRDPVAQDAPIFYAHQLQPAALRMAAFGSRGRDAFMAHWAKIKEDPSVRQQTILADGLVAGYVGSFERLGKREVCYWLGQDVWGKGVATQALAAFLGKEIRRPLWARVAKCNPASLRVVEKCGFAIVGEDSYPNKAGEVVAEFVLQLA
ncbi:MAG: GNAT family N-acetyltransferase [Elusimicrobiota bacterium]